MNQRNPIDTTQLQRMAAILLLAMAVMGLSSPSCSPVSVEPVYTEDEIIFDKKLLGTWYREDTGYIRVAEGKDKAYEIDVINWEDLEEGPAILDEMAKGFTARYDGHLGRIDGKLIVDLQPDLADAMITQWHMPSILPAHQFPLLTDVAPPTLVFMDGEWAEKYLEKNSEAISHTTIENHDDLIILTGSTVDLQGFIRTALAEGAYEHTEKALIWTLKKSDTALHFATLFDDEDEIKGMLKSGARVNATDESGYTALFLAHSEEVFDLLIIAGADPNVAIEDGKTLLMVASQRGDARKVAWLLELRAELEREPTGADSEITETGPTGTDSDINRTDKDGWTALHWAASEGHVHVAALLIHHGASTSVKTPGGKTPLDLFEDDAVRDLLSGGPTKD